MTQIEMAEKGVLSEGVRAVAQNEKIAHEELLKKITSGKIIVLKHRKNYLGIGEGLKTKVNVNIGTSPDKIDLNLELLKLDNACKYGTDTVMDLSIGGDIDKIRREIIEKSEVPVGTVPIYQAAIETIEEKGALVKMSSDKIFEVIERHAQDGVSFVTVHCGVNLQTLKRLRKNPRKTMVVSRGGAFLISWMIANEKENPLYEHFDRLLKIAKKYDIILSLGDGMRPGSITDSTDASQIEELITLGELTKIAWKEKVQVMVEGPGHIPIDEIPANVILEKKLCSGAPFYVLGPIVTDIAPGYDHITSAIGAAIAGWYGADFICYVTPSEHLSLPGPEEVIEGLISARIAAHTADIAKKIPSAINWDFTMDTARRERRWKEQKNLSINPEKFEILYGKYGEKERDVCSMCGKYCALKMVEDSLKTKIIF